jgi:hypothetical protein
LTPVEEPLTPGEILARAAAYPYEAPLRSFLQLGARALSLPPEGADTSDRRPLLCYGANAAPAVLARKLAPLPELPLPLLRAELHGFDVVYSAHISPYGAVPSTLQRSQDTTAPVFVAYPTATQEELLTATEPNYELRELTDVELRREDGTVLEAVDVYVSRHGCLVLDNSEVALAAVASAGRRFPVMGEIEVLEHARHLLAPELGLERFVESSLDPGLAAARTAVLHGGSRPLEL